MKRIKHSNHPRFTKLLSIIKVQLTNFLISMRNDMSHNLISKTKFALTYFVYLMLISFLFNSQTKAQNNNNIKLSWLGAKTPEISTGVSFGVPLPEGKYDKSTFFSIKNNQGIELPSQTWPLAYWPDGSLKWIGMGTVVDPNEGEAFELIPQQENSIDLTNRLNVNAGNDMIIVNNGHVQFQIPKNGTEIIASIMLDGKVITSGGKLVSILQNGPRKEYGPQPTKEKFLSKINNVTVEQSGPIRAVIKIEGVHKSESGSREWLPFIVRLYFYSGINSIRMVHTIIYDGDQEQDFINGLGLVFDVPLDEELYNRHIRFTGDDSRLWDEPCQPLNGRIPLFVDKKDLYAEQLTGKRIPNRNDFSERHQFLLDNWATWNDYKLSQLNADGFTIKKRTNEKSTWLDAGFGKRSSGTAFVGDVSGGIAISIKNFWQSFPSSLEISNVASNSAQLKAWFWSPEAEAMDMRHYDTLSWGHTLLASYEDVQPGFSKATGIARTSELMLNIFSDIPSNEELNKIAHYSNNTPLLTASPEYFHSIPVFGIWSLPERKKESQIWIENQLDNAIKYYQLEVEQRHWYGFWNFGDLQHGYDHQRRSWKYDMGGFAWDNTELMPNMWLWYSFLRSGREDIFRMAEAMTRHNGEVDVYHLGKFNGLGSRHNVVHWGGGAKEVRISQAALGRFYYYLTTDERTGDLMRASAQNSNEAIGKFDPLRLILEKGEYPTHARIGPDWLALVGNWMTEWERTGDTKYRDRILIGVNNFYNMPYGFFSGKEGAFGYDPATYQIYQLSDSSIGFSHLSVLMGGPEIAYELTHLLNNKEWNKLWMQFCKLYSSPIDLVEQEFDIKVKLGDPGPWYARLPAYYSHATGNKEYAEKAWNDFINVEESRFKTVFKLDLFDGIESLQPIYEVKGVSTNNTAQWCLNAIELLELVGDSIPEKISN